jgi:hypothetical protein
VFGTPLRQSLKFASVQISTADVNGELYVWGYIPVVVAKWSVPAHVLTSSHTFSYVTRSGLYLKENGMLWPFPTSNVAHLSYSN